MARAAATAGPVLDLNPAAPGRTATLDAEGPGNCAAQEVLSVLSWMPEADFTLQSL